MDEMTKMANSIISIIKWTNDCPGANRGGKMPILNLKVWMKEKVGTANRLRAKQETYGITLLRNCSPDTPDTMGEISRVFERLFFEDENIRVSRALQKEHHRVGSGSLGQESPGR